MNKEEFESRFPGKLFEDYAPHSNGGGLVEKTAHVDANAYVGKNSTVHNRATVHGHAIITDYAIISDYAVICGDSHVCNNAVVCGNAVVLDRAWICNHAVVCGNAVMRGEVLICDNVRVCGDTQMCGYMKACSGTFIKTPYSIKLSKHTLTIQADATITIGCEHHSLKHWLENWYDIGKKHEYEANEILEAYDVLMKIEAGEIK